jgi:hypothetical protein
MADRRLPTAAEVHGGIREQATGSWGKDAPPDPLRQWLRLDPALEHLPAGLQELGYVEGGSYVRSRMLL